MPRTRKSYIAEYEDGRFSDPVPEEELKKTWSGIPDKWDSNGPETKNGIISNATYVKLRKFPNMSAEVLEFLRKGTVVAILDKNEEFAKVRTANNPVGYISLKFLEEEGM